MRLTSVLFKPVQSNITFYINKYAANIFTVLDRDIHMGTFVIYNKGICNKVAHDLGHMLRSHAFTKNPKSVVICTNRAPLRLETLLYC